MLSVTEAQIYLAYKRGITIDNICRSFHTFNSGKYQDETRYAQGNLIICNDDTLKPNSKVVCKAETNMDVIIIPIVGGIEIKNSKANRQLTIAGQATILPVSGGDHYYIKNPLAKEMVNFLQIGIARTRMSMENSKRVSFNLDSQKNELLALSDNCYIGKFEGREDGSFTVRNTGSGVFAFVIEGAFEFENRLIESRDGIVIWNKPVHKKLSVAFEALSNDAIILVVEI